MDAKIERNEEARGGGGGFLPGRISDSGLRTTEAQRKGGRSQRKTDDQEQDLSSVISGCFSVPLW